MKKIIIYLILICICLIIFLKKYDSLYTIKSFDNFDNPKAIKILQNYLIQECPNFNNIYINFPINKCTHAVLFDLNNDGIDEVIGFSDAYYSDSGVQLFILEKENNIYHNISMVNFYPQKGIKIIKSKTNSFYNMQIESKFYNKNSLSEFVFDEFSIEYKNGYYQYKKLGIFNKLKLYFLILLKR